LVGFFVGGRLIGGGVHGVNQPLVNFEGVFQVAPDGFDGAGAGGGELDVAQPQNPLGQGEDQKGVLDFHQGALEDIDGEDAANTDDAAIGEDVTAADPL